MALRLAVCAAGLVWWLPSIVLLAGRLAAEGARFAAVMASSRALGVLGLRAAALRVCEAELDRCGAKLAAVRAGRGA